MNILDRYTYRSPRSREPSVGTGNLKVTRSTSRWPLKSITEIITLHYVHSYWLVIIICEHSSCLVVQFRYELHTSDISDLSATSTSTWTLYVCRYDHISLCVSVCVCLHVCVCVFCWCVCACICVIVCMWVQTYRREVWCAPSWTTIESTAHSAGGPRYSSTEFIIYHHGLVPIRELKTADVSHHYTTTTCDWAGTKIPRHKVKSDYRAVDRDIKSDIHVCEYMFTQRLFLCSGHLIMSLYNDQALNHLNKIIILIHRCTYLHWSHSICRWCKFTMDLEGHIYSEWLETILQADLWHQCQQRLDFFVLYMRLESFLEYLQHRV